MKTLTGCAMFLCISLCSITSDADAPKYQTTWDFTLMDGKITHTFQPMDKGAVILPSGTSWTCQKEPVAILGTGYVGKFICQNGRASVDITAICPQSSVGNDSSTAVLTANGESAVFGLMVICSTIVIKPSSTGTTKI